MTTPDVILGTLESIPTLPAAAARLFQLLDDPKASATHFERLITPDPALTANLLRFANSAYFGRNRQVSSVRDAIVLVGLKSLADLVVSAGFARVLPPRLPGYDVDAPTFWQHCVAVAVLSERLALEVALDVPTLTFTGGLLHDIGKLAVGSFVAEARDGVLERVWAGGECFVAVEREVLGIDHAEVGEALAARWRLPPAIGAVVRWHHAPSDGQEGGHGARVDLVHLADALAHTLGYGADVGELRREVDRHAIVRVGLDAARLERAASECHDAIRELGSALAPGGGGRP